MSSDWTSSGRIDMLTSFNSFPRQPDYRWHLQATGTTKNQALEAIPYSPEGTPPERVLEERSVFPSQSRSLHHHDNESSRPRETRPHGHSQLPRSTRRPTDPSRAVRITTKMDLYALYSDLVFTQSKDPFCCDLKYPSGMVLRVFRW